MTLLSQVAKLALLALLASTAHAQGEYLDVWAQQFGTSSVDHVRGVAPGPGGGAYVGGEDYDGHVGPGFPVPDCFVTLFDDEGGLVWTRRLASPENEQILGVAEDGQGGVIVGGRTSGDLGGPALGGTDAFVARYDHMGNQLWILQFGSATLDVVRAVIGDGSGGAYATGTTLASGSVDTFLTRISPTGSVVWTQQLGGAEAEHGTCLALDGAGGLYLAGTTDGTFWGPNAGARDCFLARIDGAGNQIWSKQFGSNKIDELHAIAVLAPNKIYVGGSTRGDLYGPTPSLFTAFVARFDGNGTELWGTRYTNTTVNDVSDVESLVPAAGGGVLALGTEGQLLPGFTIGPGDVYLTRFDDQGVQGDVQYYASSEADIATGLVQGPHGQVYLSGTTTGSLAGANAGSSDSFLIRLEPLVGATYCGAVVPNSTGLPARLFATGSALVTDNTLRLQVLDMPPHQLGIFRTSMTQAFLPGVGGSQGNLCLGGAIGNYTAPGQVQQSGTSGRMQFAVDLTQTPTPTGTVAVISGQTWNFQAWFRDQNPAPTTNFTDGVTLSF